MKLALFFILVVFSSFGSAQVTPTQRLHQSLEFADDMDFESMDLVIERQLKSFEQVGLSGTIKFGTKTYPKTALKESLLLFQEMAATTRECLKVTLREACLQNFNAQVNEKFAIYVPVASKRMTKALPTKFTSYYSPDLHGSRKPTERYKRAIYKTPDLVSDRNFTRVEIDYKGALAGKGYEIFWVEESFYDLYLLHIQGGGRINIMNDDGTKEISYLSYSSRNSQPFQMVYSYMIKQGYLQPGRAGVPDQRKFLEENPDKEEEIFGVTPSYIYFKESKEEPVGLNNIPLTEGRSLAIDSRIYKTMGLLNFVKTVKATGLDQEGNVIKKPFSRFFISQDTGGAIRGNARCDLYFGYGPMAELTAYNMNEQGEQYFLIKK